MRVDARQAWFPPAGAPHARFSSSFSSNPRPPSPGPCPRPSVCRGQPTALRHGATGRRPRAPRPRAWTPPAPGARGTEPGGGGRLAGGNVPARHGVGAGRCRRRVPMRASRRGSRGAAEAHASGARLAGPEGVEGVGGGSACATGGQGVSTRSVRPGRGPAPGQPGEGLPERFSVGAGFAATAPDLLPGAAGPGLDAAPPRGPVRPTAPAPPPGPHTPARSCTPAPPPRGDLPSTSHCRDSGSGSRTTDPRADRRGGMVGGQLS